MLYKEPSLSLRTVLAVSNFSYWFERVNPCFVTSSNLIFAICLWMNLGDIFSTVCTCTRFSVICKYMRYPTGRNLSYFRFGMKCTRYSDMLTALASSRIVYLPSLSNISLRLLRHLNALPLAVSQVGQILLHIWRTLFPVRNSFLHLQTVLNVIKYLNRPIRPTLPFSSVNICITEFCANFYTSFSFFTILNPFHNHFFYNSVQPRWAKKAVLLNCTTLTFTASWPLSNLSVRWNRAETKHFK